MYNTFDAAKAKYSFNIEISGDVQVISYKRAKYSAFILLPILFLAAVCNFFLVMLLNANFQAWVFFTVITAGGTYIIMNSLRKDGCFFITTKALIVLNKVYDKEHISEIYIKAPDGEETVPVIHTYQQGFIGFGGDRVNRIGYGAAAAVTTVVSTGVLATASAIQTAKKSIRKHYRKNNYQIGFMFGESRIKLAGGLTEDTAEVMFKKVLEFAKDYA